MPHTISARQTNKITIEFVGGDLSLVGWEGEDILIKGNDDEIQFNQNGDTVSISCQDDLSLRAPKAASIFVRQVNGDASIRGTQGKIEIQDIEGDLSIRDVNSVTIVRLQSDFTLRGAKGNVFIKSAGGDVSIRDVDGDVSLEAVADDLALRDVRGNIHANVAEDVVLYLNPQAGNVYAVNAGDDILLVMPPKANATLTLNGDEIDIEWKGVKNDEDATSRMITLGDGSAAITLTAGGDIRISNQANAGETAEDFGNFAGIGMDWSGFGERTAQRATERVGRRASAGDSAPRGVPMPPKPPISDEERMAVLKMLQEKKVTAEEAEKLLSALEGSE